MNKSHFFKFSLFLSLIILGVFSCKKDEVTPTSTVVAFTWQEDGGSVITADSAYWTTGTWGTGIRAYKNGMANFFEINWDTQENTSVGTKTLATPYGFTFIKGADTYTATTNQNLTISANTSNTLSGNCPIPTTGGPITNIKITFNNLSKRI